MPKVQNIGKVLDKVEKLISLASSPNKEEARTSAYQACKLIREHDLKVVEQTSQAQPVEPVSIYGSYGSVDFSSPEPFSKVADTGSDVVFCQARFNSKCAYCGDSVVKGSRIVWYRKKKQVFHQACADEKNKRR